LPPTCLLCRRRGRTNSASSRVFAMTIAVNMTAQSGRCDRRPATHLRAGSGHHLLRRATFGGGQWRRQVPGTLQAPNCGREGATFSRSSAVDARALVGLRWSLRAALRSSLTVGGGVRQKR
jgi:hypothetical protein